jgi:hypothetical protein
MAPPKSRRPGFSRRAQYGLFFGYVLAVGGVVVALGLLILARAAPDGFNALRGIALDLTSPVTEGGRGAVRAANESGSRSATISVRAPAMPSCATRSSGCAFRSSRPAPPNSRTAA